MNKVERVMAALAGEKVDQVPVSFWGHFYDREGSAQVLAEAMIQFNQRMDWDFMKVQARASYHAEVWGMEFGTSHDGVEGPSCKAPLVNSHADWARIEPKSPTVPPLDQHLEALKLIKDRLKGNMLFIHTVFSPLTIANYLVGDNPDKLKRLLTEDRASTHRALSAIASTFRGYLPLCLEAGASGFFFALTHGPQHNYLTAEEYREFGRPYDLMVLEGAKDAVFNMLHICRSHINLDLVRDYPVHCFNWDTSLPGNPNLGEVMGRIKGAAVGGLSSAHAFARSTTQELMESALRALDETNGRRHILGGGCSQHMKLIPDEKFMAIRDAVRSWVPSR